MRTLHVCVSFVPFLSFLLSFFSFFFSKTSPDIGLCLVPDFVTKTDRIVTANLKIAFLETTTFISEFSLSVYTTISLVVPLNPLPPPPSFLSILISLFVSLDPDVLCNSYFMIINLHAQNMLRLRCWPDRFHVTLLFHRKMTASFCQRV